MGWLSLEPLTVTGWGKQDTRSSRLPKDKAERPKPVTTLMVVASIPGILLLVVVPLL